MPGALEADYKAAGFGKSLGFGSRPALLLIDWCRAYLEPSSPLYAGVEPALDATLPLVAAARSAGIPLVFTRVEYATPADGGLFRRKIAALSCFDRGNPLADFPATLQPAPGDIVVTKQYPSAFFGTPLAATLAGLRVDSLLLSGVTTSGCVRASAVDALCHGFAPLIVTDCVGDRSPQVHAANLFDLAAKTADLVASADAIGWLSKRQ
jgi:maleamate amidohydrolase